MRLHMCSANSQITILISGSLLLEFFAPVLSCLAAIWEQTSLNCLPLIPVLVPGACQRPVLVILQGLWLGIRNLVWKLHWQQLAFCLWLYFHTLLVTSAPALIAMAWASPRELIQWHVSPARQSEGGVSSNAGNFLNARFLSMCCGRSSSSACFNCGVCVLPPSNLQSAVWARCWTSSRPRSTMWSRRPSWSSGTSSASTPTSRWKYCNVFGSFCLLASQYSNANPSQCSLPGHWSQGGFLSEKQCPFWS